jgi:protoporphyrinogen/coproporphyrinogen III oxidase
MEPVNPSNQSVAVVGSGPAGCAAAYELHRQGYEVRIFEQAAAIGGRTRTYRKDGYNLDTGAGFITNFYPRVFRLAEELGFRSDIQQMHRVSGLVHDGRSTTLNVGSVISFLRFPLLSLRDKFKMGVWTAKLSLKRNEYDIARPETLANIDSQSIAEYARAHLSEDIYHFLIRPGIEPFWYFSCEDASEGLVLGLTAQAAGARFYFVDGGIDKICQHLVKDIAIELESSVSSLHAKDESVELHAISNGTDTRRVFDRVVVATTATVASRMTQELPQDWISKQQRQFLDTQEYARNIHATFQIKKLPKPANVSSVFPCGPGLHPSAALSFHAKKHASKTAREKELVSLYFSDVQSQKMFQSTDEEIYSYAWKLAQELYPSLPAEADPFHLIRRDEAIPVHRPGRYQAADRFQEEQTRGSAPIRFCGDYLATATIDGALESGFRAARNWPKDDNGRASA